MQSEFQDRKTDKGIVMNSPARFGLMCLIVTLVVTLGLLPLAASAGDRGTTGGRSNPAQIERSKQKSGPTRPAPAQSCDGTSNFWRLHHI